MPQDIRQKGLTPLRGVNRRQEADNDDALLLQLRNRVRHGQSVTPMSYEGVAEPYHYEPGSIEAGFGESGYDSWTGTPIGSSESLQEQRHDNQSSWSVLGNGLAKLLETTGSTVAATLLGLPTGIYTAIDEGRWSGIWDNKVFDALSQFDNYMQENYKNYQSLQQQQNAESGAWWKNLGSFASVTDQISTMAGFVLGAAATGGGVGSALGKLSTLIKAGTTAAKIAPVAAQGISALVSASGEAAIEANNNTRDWKELQYQKLEDELNELYANDGRVQAIQQKYQTMAMQLQQRMQSDPNLQTNAQYYQQQAQQLEAAMTNELSAIDAEKEQRRQAGRMQIDEDARRAGNRIMAANQVLLTLGNLTTLGRVFKKSYRSASEFEHLLNAESMQGLIKNETKGMTTAQRAAAAAQGEAYTSRSAKEQLFRDWAIPLFSEGSEEMNQRFISSASGAYYQREDANDYWRAKLDPDSIKDTIDGSHEFGSALSQGFADSWGNPAAYEEFFYGALMGVGSSALSSGFGTKTMDEVREAEKATKALNEMIGADGYYQRLAQLAVTLNYYGKQKEAALASDDMKAWKDADDKEMARIIETYYRAGKLGDLRKDIEDAGGELTDEQVEQIIRDVNLTPEQDKEVKAAPLRKEVKTLADEVNELQRQLAELMGNAPQQQRGPDKDNSQPENPEPPSGPEPPIPPAPTGPSAPQADNAPDLDDAARSGGFGNIDANGPASGSIADDGLPSEAEDAEAERQANIARIQQEIAEKKARIDALNQQISGIQGTVSGAFAENGAAFDKDRARQTIIGNKESLLRRVDDYADSINTVRYMTKGNRNDETENELFYLHFLAKAARRRIKDIANSWDETRLPQKMHILWDTEKDGSIDGLRKKLGVGAEVGITVDTSTPEGSVTLDLSRIKESDTQEYARLVHDVFLGGFYRMADDNDAESAMEQRIFAAEQLKDYASEKGLDAEEMHRKLRKDGEDMSELFKDANAYDAAYLEAMLNPDKARKRAKKLKDKVKNKIKKKKESDAWDKATFEDWQAGRLDGIKPKTEAQRRKKKAFEKRAGVKRDVGAVLNDIPLPDKDKADLSKILDAVIDSATGDDGSIDMDAIKKFLAEPEDTIRALFESDGALFQGIIEESNWENDQYIDAAIKRFANSITNISDDVFNNLEEIERNNSIPVDDETLQAGADDSGPELPSMQDERQPGDVPPAQDRTVTPEEAKRREQPAQPPVPPTNEQERAVNNTQSDLGAVPETDNGKAWNSQVTESGYGNEHRPWFKVAKDQLERTKQHSSYNPNESFGLIIGVDNKGNPIRTNLKKTEAQWLALMKRQEAIWNAFNGRYGVFDYLNEGNVHEGEDVYFATDPELNKQAGCTVILLVNKDHRVIGCIPDKAEKRSIASLQDALQDDWDKVPEDERNGIHVFDESKYKTHVYNRNMGKALYMYSEIIDNNGDVLGEQQEQRLLNDVADESPEPLIIGVVTGDNGLSTSDDRVTIDNTVRSNQKAGTPVVVVKSRGAVHDGKQYTTAPIATPWFSTEMTPFVGLIEAAVYKAIQEVTEGNPGEGEFAAFAILKDILNLAGVDIKKSNSGGLNLHVHYNRLTGRNADGSPIYTRQDVYQHIRKDHQEEDIAQFIQQLQEQQAGINVSAKWLKADKFKTAIDSLTAWNTDKYGEKPTSYPRLIGSIVYTNVGDLTTHSEWFDVNPLVKQGDKFVEITKEQLTPTNPQATKRGPQTRPITSVQARKAQTDEQKKMATWFAAKCAEFLQAGGAQSKDAIRNLYNKLVTAFGADFMRSATGDALWEQVQTIKPGEEVAMSSSMWNFVMQAYKKKRLADAARKDAQNRVGQLADSGVDADEEAHEYTRRSDGKKLSGITSTLLEAISIRLFGNVPQTVLDAAKKRGHIVHKFIELMDSGRDFGEMSENDLHELIHKYDSYKAALEAAGLRVAYNEYTVTDGTAFASKIDLVLVDKDGNIVLGDIKTNSDPKTAEQAQGQKEYVTKQLSIYRHMFNQQNPGKKAMSKGVVMHINNNRIELEWVDLQDEASIEQEMRDYRDANNMEQPKPAQPEQAQPATTGGQQATEGKDPLFDDVVAFARGRDTIRISDIQRHFEIGWLHAEKLLYQLKDAGVIAPEPRSTGEWAVAQQQNPFDNIPLPSELPQQQSLFDRFVSAYGDIISQEEFDEIFKGHGYYQATDGTLYQGNEALRAFADDWNSGMEIPDQPDGLASEVEESGRLPERMDTDKELAWLKRALPNMSNEQHLKLLNTLIKLGNNRMAYGMMSKGIIYLYKYGAQGTVYHEAFHAVTQGLLTDKELLKLYQAAREKYGDLPIVELEEKLANDFQRYMIEREYYKGKEKNIFRKLLDWITGWFQKKDVIDQLYEDINSGKFGNRIVKTSSNVFSTINNQQIAENRHRLANTVNTTEQEALDRAGVSKQEFNAMTAAQKYSMKHCLV